MTARDLMHELRECRTVADCHAFRASVPDEAMTSAIYAALIARIDALRKAEGANA